jgi:putative hemolysin
LETEPFSFILLINLVTQTNIIQILVILVLLFFSALISGAEVAFFSINPELFHHSQKEEDKSIKRIQKLLSKPKRLLATILVANNFINIAIVLLFSSLGNFFLNRISNTTVVILIEVGVITVIILLFGEILPKIYASRNSLYFSKIVAVPISFLDRYILFWITIPMSKTTSIIESKLSNKYNEFSVDKLSQALELTSNDETTVDEQKILQGIVNFGNTDTKEVMCPRIDVFALPEEMNMTEIIPKITEKGFSRIPVYKDSIDEITGILYVKDLLPNLKNKNFSWNSLIKKPFYVPENKKLDDLLKEFQQKKIHLAIVVDEYGGTSGVVSLEDIIEEIVGDISDEFDEELLNYSKIDENLYLFEAKINLKDFYRIIKIEESDYFDEIKGDPETLAGLLLELVQKFPKNGMKINYKKIQFTIEEVDKKRIKRVKVKLIR